MGVTIVRDWLAGITATMGPPTKAEDHCPVPCIFPHGAEELQTFRPPPICGLHEVEHAVRLNNM
jgi:hypothetical protein